MVSPWQRHLLMLSGEEEEGAMALSPEAALVAAAVLVVLVMLTLLCVCGDGSSGKGEAEGKNTHSTKTSLIAADPAAIAVEDEVAGETNHLAVSGEATPIINGVANGVRGSSSPSGHSRQESSGSAQMRPTGLRELPDLPINNHKRNHSGAGLVDKQASGRSSGDETKNNNAYDHLGAKITQSKTASVNYDHIKLDSPRESTSPGTTPASEPDTTSEGHYAQVRERTYDVVKDVRSRASAKVAATTDYDPYAKVKDEDDDKEDPYSKVRDSEKEDEADDDYSHLKHDHVIITLPEVNTTNMAMMEDEDPYEKVMGDSGGARVVDASNAVDPDDPYSVVSDQPQVTVVPLNSGSSPPRGAAVHAGGDHGRNSGSNLNNKASAPLSSEELLRLQFADEEADSQDDYATVVKDRNPSTSREEGPEQGRSRGDEEEEIEPYFTTPSEPPRMYDASEVGTLLPRAAEGAGDDDSAGHNGKEHRYTKVTARESLASMTARNALNTYEVVPDLPENTYATVEGGSGDGVVGRYATPGTPCLQHTTSLISDTYTEIGASGGYANPAPEPPSLDSLHSMTKSTSSSDGDHFNNTGRPPTSPSATHPNVIIADDGYAVVSKTSGFSPSETALPQIPRAGTSGSVGSLGSLGEEVMINGVTLHPDYHSVKDCIPADQDNENDPNYESVDEALSKVPAPSSMKSSSSSPKGAAPGHSKVGTGASPNVTIINHMSPSRRTHQYEEVSPPSSPLASPPMQVSSRVSAGVAAASSSNGASANGASLSGMIPRQANIDAQAAEVRDRVLQGHMYEAISEVKTRQKASQRKTDSQKNENSTKL